MSNVIHVNFAETKDHDGYIMDEGKIEGVYLGDLVAHNDGEICRIGERTDSGILEPIEMSVEDLNRFCIMWLCIFDPESIAGEE